MDGSRQHPSLAYRASSSGTLIVACRSTPSQLCDDFNEFLLLLEIMVDFVALRGLPSAHFGKAARRLAVCLESRSCLRRAIRNADCLARRRMAGL